MLYDCDCGIDWTTDTQDTGWHLNYFGARKVTQKLGEYLTAHYDLSQEDDPEYDRDLETSDMVSKVALLEMSQDFDSYLNMLATEFNDKTILISASDDMISGLNENDRTALRKLGLQTDFLNAKYSNSFLAIIQNGKVSYEAISNRKQQNDGNLLKGNTYSITSSGYLTTPLSQIMINGTDYSRNMRGINIVVYDDEHNLVLDSVNFDTCAKEHTCNRDEWNILHYLRAYENYLIEVERR